MLLVIATVDTCKGLFQGYRSQSDVDCCPFGDLHLLPNGCDQEELFKIFTDVAKRSTRCNYSVVARRKCAHLEHAAGIGTHLTRVYGQLSGGVGSGGN